MKMKRVSKRTVVLGLSVLLALATSGLCVRTVAQEPLAKRLEGIKSKGEQVKRGLQEWVKDGRDVSEIVTLAKRVPMLVQQGQVDEAEMLLDRALKLLSEKPRQSKTAVDDRGAQIKAKADKVMRGVAKWVKEGHNPADIVALTKRVKALMDRGKVDEAETLLDLALHLLGREPSALKGLENVHYQELLIRGQESRNGIYDPSLEYNTDGSVGWLAYSSVSGPHRFVGPYIETRLARSTDAGQTWTFVKVVNTAEDGEIQHSDGNRLQGVWRHEVATIVHDPTDIGKEWKMFSHKYFTRYNRQRMPTFGWISMRHTHDPAGEWSDDVPLFGAGRFPPNPYHKTRIDLNAMHPDLSATVAYTEPGALVHDGILYLSMTSVIETGPDFLFLLASRDHGTTWNYVGKLLDKRDATILGDSRFDGSSLCVEHDNVYLLTTPQRSGYVHFGTYVFEFDDITRGILKRDPTSKPIVMKHFLPQGAFLSGIGAGQSTYDQHNINGGLIFPQINLAKHPEIFHIFNTKQTLVSSSGSK